MVLASMGAIVMTGCQQETAPTGDALYADAEKTYFEYRGLVNEALSVISTGPWSIDHTGDYGMLPGRCDHNAGYQFDMARSLQIDIADRERYADAVMKHLEAAGMSPSRGALGSGDRELIQVSVDDEGGFEKILFTFGYDSRVLLDASTTCRPGDAFALADLIFGDEHFLGDYLPAEESPTDPLFFGITPGEPKLRTPTSTPTPTA